MASSSDPRQLITSQENDEIQASWSTARSGIFKTDPMDMAGQGFELGFLAGRSSSPAPDAEGAIVWRDEPDANARIYQHVGCDEATGGWVVPLDDMPPPVRSEMECARCCKIVPFKAGFAPELAAVPSSPAPDAAWLVTEIRAILEGEQIGSNWAERLAGRIVAAVASSPVPAPDLFGVGIDTTLSGAIQRVLDGYGHEDWCEQSGGPCTCLWGHAHRVLLDLKAFLDRDGAPVSVGDEEPSQPTRREEDEAAARRGDMTAKVGLNPPRRSVERGW